MAPKKRPAKETEGKVASATKKPGPKKASKAGKKSVGVAKKPTPKKPVGKTPAAIKTEAKKEAKKKSVKGTSKSDTVIKEEHEEISDKPAGNTRAATKRKSNEAPIRPAGKSLTTTIKKPRGRPTKAQGKTGAATKEPIPEPVDIPSEDTPAASPKRKRETKDKWTETTDLPVPKSPKIDAGSSPGPTWNSREIRTREYFISEGWDIKDFNSELCCVDTVDLSRIPSPFANLANRSEKFMHIIDNHADLGVRRLFNSIYGGGTSPLLILLDGSPPGAFFAVQKDETSAEFFVVRSDRHEFSHEFSHELRREDEASARVSFDVHIRKNPKTDGIDYFVVGDESTFLVINEKLIGKKLAGGPLPDFAVLLIGRSVIFWWRTRAAMDYIPEVISQGPKEVENKEPPPPPPYGKEGADTTEEPSPPFPTAKKGCETAKDPSVPSAPASVGEETADEPPLPPTSWEEVLHLRLAAHNEDRDAAGHGHGYHQIASASGMTLDDVLIAVATFWEPLRNQGTGFAFAGASVIDQYLQQMAANGLVPDLGVVGEGNVFIMPLWFPPDLEDTEKRFKENHEIKNKGQNAKAKAKKGNSIALGHLLLGVAEKDSGQSKKVNIKIFDSRPITLERDLIRKRATELACAWLGPAVKTEFDFRTVPQQQENSNACGLHVILNAWAIMLGIGLITQRVRPREGCEQHPGFLENGLAIVNLALAGFMDSRTIQAFLNYYGHTAVEDPLFREDDTKNTVIAVSMDSNRFERALGRPSPSSSQTSAHNNSSTDVKKAVSESKVQQFMEMATNATLELAEHFIATEGEDVEKALTAFAVHQSQLDGPTGSETS